VDASSSEDGSVSKTRINVSGNVPGNLPNSGSIPFTGKAGGTLPDGAHTDGAQGAGIIPTVGTGGSASADVKAEVNLPAAGGINPRLVSQIKLSAIVGQVVVLILAALSLAGWAFNIQELKHPIDEPALQSPSTINFIALAFATLLLCLGSPGVLPVVFARSIGLLAAAAAAVAFIEHTCHIDCHFVLVQPPEGLPVTYPGPLVPHESFPFFLLGLGVLVFNVIVKKKLWLSQLIAGLVFVPNLIVLFCYMVGQSHICIYFGCVQLSPITSLLFVMASYGLFFALPDVGAARIFSLESTAGRLARRTFVGVSILLLLLLPRQWLISVGEAAQLVDASTVNAGTAVVALAALCVFGWWGFRKIESEQTEKIREIVEKDKKIELLQQEKESSVSSTRRLKLVCLQCMLEFTDIDMGLTNCPDDQSVLIRILDTMRPGTIFGERYRIERELGSGGMSTVYLAYHLLMNKDVAVKVLQTQFATDPKTIQRFQREAQAASSLSHPNLVAVYDFNITEDGQAFMVMEFLEGISLSQLIADNKPLPWREAVPLFLQILEGVAHAHGKGVIHRDLKPGNVMLTPAKTGEQIFLAKIVDFGFAKVGDDGQLNLTRTGEVFGSPLYMSPEQCRGLPMDQRSDLYAIGCMMYACLAGEAPFQGLNIMDTLSMHLNEPPPLVPDHLGVPDWLRGASYKAMSKDPEMRFQNAADLSAALLAGLEAGRGGH
jgi:Protein kinase domain